MQRVLCLSFLLAFAAGCGLELNKSSEEKRTVSGVGGVLTGDPMAPDPVKPPPAETPAPEAAAPATPIVPPAETPSADPATAAPTEPEAVREKAAAGAGKKGNYEGSGLVVTPIKAYFRAQERIAFEIQIPHAMNLFKATNDRFPKDMEEFKSQILEPSNIKLPELPRGHKYVYDGTKGELQVEHPPK